jgi:hypothetical protein
MVLEGTPSLVIKTATARELGSANDLVGTRLMPLSERYMNFVWEEDQRLGNPPERHAERLSRAFHQAAAEVVEHSRRVTEARQQLKEEPQANRRLEKHREQLEGVLSSRTWRVLDGLNRKIRRVRARE